MAVAQPCVCKEREAEWEREVEEKRRRRRWRERLSRPVQRIELGMGGRDTGENSRVEDGREEETKGEEGEDKEKEGKWKETNKNTDERGEKGQNFQVNVSGILENQEEFNQGCGKLWQKHQDLTDDGEAGAKCSTEGDVEDDAEDDEEDDMKLYTKDTYASDIFQALVAFRISCVLTDLTIRTQDGVTFQVHSPVLAAVSSLVRDRLRERDRARSRKREITDNETDTDVQSWSLSLGPELDPAGIQAVLEFAYSGDVAALNRDTVAQIRAAAHTLGVPRVLELCDMARNGDNRAEGTNCAAEQRKISLQSINDLRMGKVGCDVTLAAVGASLHAHRVILAACSDYFRGMFTHGMKESRQSTVTLPFLLASDLQVLIGCSYCGALALGWDAIFEITRTSRWLQYQPALSLCLNFLQNEINVRSCLDVASFAEAYDVKQLLEVADDFVLRQFQRVSCTAKFSDLPSQKLLKYLNSPSLCVPSELVVFRGVVAWIQFRPETRLKFSKQLMKKIRFSLMTFGEFKEVQAADIWTKHKLVELYESVFKEFCYSDTAPHSQCRIYLPKDLMVLVGGDRISDNFSSRCISGELWFANSLRNHTGVVRAVEWRRLGEMPEPPRCSHEVAVLKGQLYVIGGRKYYGINDILDSAYRYDPLRSSWERLADMREKRCCFPVVVLGGMLYAIGGDSNPGCLDSVECYCPATNSWSFTQPLNAALTGHAARVLDKRVFVSGGFNARYQCLASTALYHPEQGSTNLADMAAPRAHHCMEALGGRLYVAGGVTTDDCADTVNQLACETYDPAANSWTAFASLPVPHVGAASAVLEERMYVLGGFNQKDCNDIKMVHRYDPIARRWENMGRMPGPNTDIRATILCLPSHLRL